MMEHLEKAFAFDIHVRRDVDEKFPANGIKVVATDVREVSGDTRVSDNLIKFAKGADLLIHEVGMSKQDPRLAGPLDERLPGGRGTRRQLKSIAEHHTDPAEAGMVFEKVKPKLAMFSHYTGGVTATALSLVRQTYS